MAKRRRIRNSLVGRKFRRLRGEALENRNLLAVTFVVNSTGDATDSNPSNGTCETATGNGICTLRAAIASANATANGVTGPDLIHFNIPVPGVQTIHPTSSYGITEAVIIDAYTQAGASPNTLPVGTDAVLLIELDGSSFVSGSAGLNVQSSSSKVRGLVMNRYQSTPAIELGGSGGHVVEGNYIGTNASGTADLGNDGGILFSSPSNLVGGATSGARNVISGNGSFGIRAPAFTSSNSVKGNFIGLDATGTFAIGNSGSGVDVLTSSNNVIGGATPADRNVISGNTGFGIQIQGDSGNNFVRGNYVGLDASGNFDRGNGSMGIMVDNADLTFIGGAGPGEGNVISGNQDAGIEIKGDADNTSIQGNIIGLNAAGSLAIGNGSDGIRIIPAINTFIGGTAPGAGNLISGNSGAGIRVVAGASNRIQQNSIYLNGQLGIDLSPNGVNANDNGDGDFGPNNLQNFPIVTSVLSSLTGTDIEATLNSTPNTTFTIEFFSSNVEDPSGFGEGEVFLIATTATTDVSGNASISVTLPSSLTPGHVVTATATNPFHNTSEFSAAEEVFPANIETTTTITSDNPDPSVVGQSYDVSWTVTATVSVTAGTVTVDDGQGNNCSAPVTAGQCSLASTSAGLKTLTASYSGNGIFDPSSDTELHQVNQANTSTAIISDLPDPSVVGESYTVSWTVSVNAPGSGIPTGTVTVDDGNGNTCSANVSVGSCALVSTSAGNKNLVATYSGDTNFVSSSDTENHVVNPASTTLTITSDSPDPSVVGQSYLVTWSLAVDAPGAGTPTGTVTVDDGTGGTCSAAVSVGGCSIVSTSVGSKVLTANYSGDANFESSSDTENHVVNKANTTLTITSDSPDPSVVGQSYLISWSLAVNAPGAGTPNGTVTVDDGTGGTCSAAVSVGGCSLVSTSVGSKTLTANYSGDVSFESSSDTEDHVVRKANTTLTITSDSPDPSVVGQSYLVSWSLEINDPGAYVLTGTVTVDDGTGGTCSADVSVGGCSIVSTSAGSKILTASYSGNVVLESSSDTENHVVNKANTTLTITSDSPDPSVVGQSYLVTWSLAVNAPGAGTPTGTVTVNDGTGGTCSAAVSAGGCSLVSTSAGSKVLTANYSGDVNFASSSDTENHVVNRANTTLTITSDFPDPSVAGQPYLVTWSLVVNSPGAGTPTGVVTVFDNNGNFCSAAQSAGGCLLVSTSSGTKIVTAVYGGDTNFVGSFDFEMHQVRSFALQPDICDPSETRLVVGGTTSDDTIVITRVGTSNTYRVRVNGTVLGDFASISRVVVFAQAGNDDLQVGSNVQIPLWLHGGNGDDQLMGGAAADVLWGDEGNDYLEGGSGRDLLIGGTGADRFFGNSGDDILIAGQTDYDAVDLAICNIMDEWTRSDANYNQRVNHLNGTEPGGLNDAYYLTDETVHDDGVQDLLTGNSGQDWFLLNVDGDGILAKKDYTTDKNSSEFASDIDETP